LTQKNTQSNVQKEENLEDVQIDEQETDEPEMNTYEIPGGHSNITREETSSLSDVDSHAKATFLRKENNKEGAAIQQMANVMIENSYLRQRRHEEKTTIWDMDESGMFFLVWPKLRRHFLLLNRQK
jgi:hypothetical protein